MTTAGGRSWRFRYVRAGRDSVVVFGHYPAVTLAQARQRRDVALAAVREGADPAEALRPADSAPTGPTFEDIAREWHAKQRRLWKPHHAADVLESLAREIFPTLGKTPIDRMTAPDVPAALRPVEVRGAVDTAHRVLEPVVRTGRRPAVVDVTAARAMLAAAESVPAYPVTRLALRVLALTTVRPGDLRPARWGEFGDLSATEPIWTIPGERRKSTRERAVDVPHGWRATFSTVMNERHPADRAVIDLMLAHVSKDQVERAYKRATHMVRRRIARQQS